MKRLTLLRHAKSSWDDPVARDFDRPLNARGKRAARRMGRYIRDEQLDFDHLISSPAVRCTETLDRLWEGLGREIEAAWDRRVYLASAATLMDVIHDAPDTAQSLLVCGHNPGFEDLILSLIPDRAGDPLRDAVETKFPTAALAEIRFDVDAWGEVRSASGVLTRFVRPRDLDSELGPDAASH